jgi:hypothetical protein
MHRVGNTKDFKLANQSANVRQRTNQKLALNQDHDKKLSAFIGHQQKMREKLWPDYLQKYTSGSGDITTALWLVTLLMSAYGIRMVEATSLVSRPSRSNQLDNQTNREEYIRSACSKTSLLPANKPEGALMHFDYDLTSNKYDLVLAWPGFVADEEFNKLIEEQKIREEKFLQQDVRGRAQVNQRITNKKVEAECIKVAKVNFDEGVQTNVMNHIVRLKLILFETIKGIYSDHEVDQQVPLMGNCFEMTAQACLLVMPELKPDEEFFLEIAAKNRQSGTYHVYGIIIPRNLLNGEGITSSSQRQKQFTEKFSQPFFNEGKAIIEMGANDQEAEKNTILFWQALGISNGVVKNKKVSNQAKLCDPYMGKGLYGDLEKCFSNQKMAQTYVLALETITRVIIRTWTIPRELKPKMNNFIECTNDKINQHILSLIENQIRPAAIKAQKKSSKSDL